MLHPVHSPMNVFSNSPIIRGYTDTDLHLTKEQNKVMQITKGSNRLVFTCWGIQLILPTFSVIVFDLMRHKPLRIIFTVRKFSEVNLSVRGNSTRAIATKKVMAPCARRCGI